MSSPCRCKLLVLDVAGAIEVRFRKELLGLVGRERGALGRLASQDGDELGFRDPAVSVEVEALEGSEDLSLRCAQTLRVAHCATWSEGDGAWGCAGRGGHDSIHLSLDV